MFVEHLLTKKKTAILILFHCSLLLKRPVKHLENNGFSKKAGDGIRTRDSLLGRQEPTKTLPKSCPSAWQANRLTPQKFLSGLTKAVTNKFHLLRQKRS